jgi:hypothetical protein
VAGTNVSITHRYAVATHEAISARENTLPRVGNAVLTL